MGGSGANQGNREGLPDSSKGPDGIGNRKFIVASSAGCVDFLAMLNSWATDVDKVNS